MAKVETQGENETTTPKDLGFGRQDEIEVERVRETDPRTDEKGYVSIRMAETIEEFTYGNPRTIWRLERGKRYLVFPDMAEYLWNLGKLLD